MVKIYAGICRFKLWPGVGEDDRAVPFPDNNVGVGNGMTGLTRMLFVLVQFLCAKAYK